MNHTSWFLPCVRARALRAPVFLSSLPPQMGRCAPPAHCSSAASYSFFFPLDHRGCKIWGPLSPAPIAALCYSFLFLFSFSISSFSTLFLLGAILRLPILLLLYFKLFFVLQTCILMIYTIYISVIPSYLRWFLCRKTLKNHSMRVYPSTGVRGYEI